MTDKNSSNVNTMQLQRSSSTMHTQTDWSWLGDVRTIELLKRGFHMNDDVFDEIPEIEQSELNYNSKDDDDNESNSNSNKSQKSVNETPILESVGPPQILKFKGELRTTIADIDIEQKNYDDQQGMRDKLTMEDDQKSTEDELTFGSYLKTMKVNIVGGTSCQFCLRIVKPWPSITTQEFERPHEVFCCNDYREFVETLIEIEQEKTDKDASSLNQNSFENFKNSFKQSDRQIEKRPIERKPLKKLLSSQSSVTMENDPPPEPEPNLLIQSGLTNLIPKPVPIPRKLSKQEKQIEQRPDSAASSSFTKHLKTISYQLSNLRYMQEGWTVKPECFFEFEEFESDDDDDSEAEQTPDNIFSLSKHSIKMPQRPMIIKHYKSGEVFLIIFPDGSGNVYYPSGRLAILISVIAPYMHILTIYDDNGELSGYSGDVSNATLLGVFDPFGNVCCNYTDGKMRMQMNAFGGIELDERGNRRKRWLWWDATRHIHVPPYQPFIFMLNKVISVKMYSQDKIYVSFFAASYACKFRVGTKLQVARPDCIPKGFKQDPNEIFLKNVKSEIAPISKGSLFLSDILKRIKDKYSKIPNLKNLTATSTNFVKLPKIPSTSKLLQASKSLDTQEIIRKKKQSNKFLLV